MLKRRFHFLYKVYVYLISYQDTGNYHGRLGHSGGTLCFKDAAARLKCAVGCSNWLPHVSKVRPHIFLVIQKIFQMILQMIFQSCGRGFKHMVARLKYAIEPVKQVAACLNCKHVTACFKPAIACLKHAAGCSNTRSSD